MVDTNEPVEDAPVVPTLKKGTLSAPAEDSKFSVVEEEIAPTEDVVEEVVPAVVPVATPAKEVAPSEVVEVFANKIIYKNKMAKKSMSVWQVQRRMFDLGYTAVKKAKPGYYEDITQSVVDAYRVENKLGTGQIDEKFLKAIFKDDKSVKLILA